MSYPREFKEALSPLGNGWYEYQDWANPDNPDREVKVWFGPFASKAAAYKDWLSARDSYDGKPF